MHISNPLSVEYVRVAGGGAGGNNDTGGGGGGGAGRSWHKSIGAHSTIFNTSFNLLLDQDLITYVLLRGGIGTNGGPHRLQHHINGGGGGGAGGGGPSVTAYAWWILVVVLDADADIITKSWIWWWW